jgi:hypothetical protein
MMINLLVKCQKNVLGKVLGSKRELGAICERFFMFVNMDGKRDSGQNELKNQFLLVKLLENIVIMLGSLKE